MQRRLIGLLLVGLVILTDCMAGANGFFTPKPGEILTYRIYIAGLALGTERLTSKATTTPDGRPALEIEMTVDSFPSVFGLVDYHEKRAVLWDEQRALPFQEEGSITQRRSTVRDSLVFQPERGIITASKASADGTVRNTILNYDGAAQTGCSLLSYFRTFPWERGETRVSLVGHDKVGQYSFTATVQKQSVTVPFGTFTQTYHLSNAELRYDIWFDRGAGHLPVEIRSRAGFGLAQAKLLSAEKYI